MAIPLMVIDAEGLAGVALPQGVLDRLHLGIGDTVCLIQTVQGFELRAQDSELTRQMEIAGSIMKQDHDVLRNLAESSPVP